MAPTAVMAAGRPAALTAAQGVALLNEQREASGIPGALVEEPLLSRGCLDFLTLYREAPGQYPHEERAGQPGYTPAGAEAVSHSDLSAVVGRPSWSATANPWWETTPAESSADTPSGQRVAQPAPLHITSLFNPAATSAWYGESVGEDGQAACMGTGGERVFTAPAFFAFPNTQGLKLPTYVHAAEIPWTPQMALGIPASAYTGPNFVLWPEDTDAEIASATLTAADGRQFPVRAVVPSMPAPPPPAGWPRFPDETVGVYSGNASFIVPTTPLAPSMSFALAVEWRSPTSGATYAQSVSFTTTSQVEPPQSRDVAVTLKVTDRHVLTIHTAGRILVDHPATIVVKPCRIIPSEDECYGTRAIDYKKRITLTGTDTRVPIPHLRGDGEVNVTVAVAQFLIGGADYGGGTSYSGGADICWPRGCAG